MSRLLAPRTLLWTGMAAFAAAFSALSILRYLAFNTGRFDLGNMVQAIWTTSHGHLLQQTGLQGQQFSRLGVHFEPILLVFAGLWRIWPSPEMLLAVQAIVLALGALPVYWLAEKHLRSERAALGLALAYLIYPPLQWLALDEFHPGALACTLLLFAFWYLDEDRLVAFAVFAVLACTCREEMPLVVAGMGAWYALSRRRWAVGGAIVLAGLAAAALIVGVVTPHFRHGEPLSFYGRYKDVGGSPRHVLATIFTHPVRVLEIIFDWHGVRYLLELVFSLAGLCLFAPLALLAAVPLLVLNMLSGAPAQTSIHFHYTAGEIPIFVAASVLGAAWLARKRPGTAVTLAGIAVAAALIANYLLGPLPFWSHVPGGQKLQAGRSYVSGHDRITARGLKLIPPKAVVSATNSLGSHLSARPKILSFPETRDATWVAFDTFHPSYADRTVTPKQARRKLEEIRRSPRWRLVFDESGVEIFRRESSAG